MKTFGWGVFCACSWTWVIGMYLPTFLLLRFGWPGFFVFAIPNVLGCAAFGYVLKTRETSLKLVTKHQVAMKWFSLVTIAYHVFFIGFACQYLLPGETPLVWLPLAIGPALLLVSWALSVIPFRGWPVIAVLVYATSLTAFSMFGIDPLREIPWDGEWPMAELPWLAPTIAIGFLLCPYLDPTFHRALQQSNNPHSFGVFGVTFAIMIVFTCAYWTIAETKLTSVLMAHLIAQGVFTMAVHLKEVRALSIDCCKWKTSVWALSPLVVLPLAYTGVFFEDAARGFLATEAMYIRFLVFYGLVFPAYVLLFMGPFKRRELNKRQLIIYGVVVFLSFPLYEAGFLHHLPWLLAIPMVVLIVLANIGPSKPAAMT